MENKTNTDAQVAAQVATLTQTIESLAERLTNLEQGCASLNENYNGHIKELHINKGN
jgi:hypothetical protein|tara:strand:- start:172 stop:342 length:171 start_codon:yes stop_codon:yes gene_type:complete